MTNYNYDELNKDSNELIDRKVDLMCKMHVLLMTMMSAQEMLIMNSLKDGDVISEFSLKMETMKANIEAIANVMSRLYHLFFLHDGNAPDIEEVQKRMDAELIKFKEHAARMSEVTDEIDRMMKS